MRHTDVVIAGGGLAGSLAAAMLGRAGIDAVLVDPHPVYPPDFRCEKLDGMQMRTLRLTGLADAVLRASTADRECWVARLGRVVEKLPGDQRGILYDTLVNTVRSQIPARHRIHPRQGHGHRDRPGAADRQAVERREISARLVVLATGLNIGVRAKARHRPRGHQPRPFDLDRLRCRAGGPAGVPVPRADLFRRAAGGPDGLHHAVSDRRQRCAPTCSSIATCTIPG